MPRTILAAFVSWCLLAELRLAKATRLRAPSADDTSPALPPLALVGSGKAVDPNWNQNSLQSTDTFGEDFVHDENGRKGNGYQDAFNKMEKEAREKFAAEEKKKADEKAKIEKKKADEKAKIEKAKKAEEAKAEATKKAADAKEAAVKKEETAKKAAEEQERAEAERKKAVEAQQKVLDELQKKAWEAGEDAAKKEKEALEHLDQINHEKKDLDEEHHAVQAAEKDVVKNQVALDAKQAEYDALCEKVKQKRKEREEAEARLANATRDAEVMHNVTEARKAGLKEQLAAGVRHVDDAHAAKNRRKQAEKELHEEEEKLDVMTGKKPASDGPRSSARCTSPATGFLIAAIALPLSLRVCFA